MKLAPTQLFNDNSEDHVINLLNLKLFAILMSRGSPHIKAKYVFQLVLGSRYQTELDQLISTGMYQNEELAANNLKLNYDDQLFKHAMR